MGGRAVYERRHIVGGVCDKWSVEVVQTEPQLKGRCGDEGREGGGCGRFPAEMRRHTQRYARVSMLLWRVRAAMRRCVLELSGSCFVINCLESRRWDFRVAGLEGATGGLC